MAEECELDRLAREEILQETKRAAIRAQTLGPQGWMKCPLPRPNKRFLRNAVMQAMSKGDSHIMKHHKHRGERDSSTNRIDCKRKHEDYHRRGDSKSKRWKDASEPSVKYCNQAKKKNPNSIELYDKHCNNSKSSKLEYKTTQRQ